MKTTQTRSLSGRVFRAQVTFAVLVAVAATFAAAFVFHASLLDDAKKEIREQCATISAQLDRADTADAQASALRALTPHTMRATLVAPDGHVICDTAFDAAALPSHKGRAEVDAALASGTGSAERTSATAHTVSLYYAQRLDNGAVLRLATDRGTVSTIFSRDLTLLALVVVAVVVASWAASRILSKRLVDPILAIDVSGGHAVAPYRELEPLVDRLNEQQAELIGQMERLRGVDAYRVEFTANVTHELKTPIASIQGAAELIRDGICQPEDVPEFANRIYQSARHLSALVSDILTLSRLDESERAGDSGLLGPKTECDLLAVARDVVERLQDRAFCADVRLVLQGARCVVQGNAVLLDEMISNLCDNAIRYNRPGGTVCVQVYQSDGHPVVRVSDTGHGIPEEAQPKVFERFYRVDKSRSRANGGTGLGLAIVKHAAAYHDAEIELESAPEEGTTIAVTFPSVL